MHDHPLVRFRELAAELGSSHRLAAEDSEWLALLHVALGLVRSGCAPDGLPVLEELAVALTNDDVLEAATGPLGMAMFRDDDLERTMHELFAAVARRAPGSAGAHVALARSWEGLGNVAAMERALRHALRIDADHRLAHGDLGELAALRGEHRVASRHFDRAGRPPMGLPAIVANLVWGPIRGERNEACPCDSGLRFKRCCAQTDGWPVDARVMMLPTRLADWAVRPVWLRRRLSFAAAAAGLAEVDDDPDRAVEAAIAPGMLELYLYEGGGFGRLVADVGHVLRADEREVLAAWSGCRHDLYEVLGRGPGGTRLRLVRTGEVRAVASFDDELLEGDGSRVLAVLLPGAPSARKEWVLAGEPIPVDDDIVEEIRDILDTGGDPAALARAAITPIVEFQRLIRSTAAADDEGRVERLRWLFDDGIDLRRVRGLDDLDDLVTTIHMRGGGVSAAADYIRGAARQVAAAEPPEVWAMAQQLTAAGYDRDIVLVHLACAWYAATLEGPDPDDIRAAHLANLRDVPARVAAEPIHRRRARPR